MLVFRADVSHYLHTSPFVNCHLLYFHKLVACKSSIFVKMSGKLGSFLDSIGTFFGSGDDLPWTNADIIASCEREAAGEGAGLSKDSDKSDSIMRLSWALVHSRHHSDVQRGIAMLEAALDSDGGPVQKREILYLLAVGHYRADDYARSRQYIDRALQIAPNFRQASTLRKIVEDKIAKDGVIGIGLSVAAAGLVVGALAAALSHKK